MKPLLQSGNQLLFLDGADAAGKRLAYCRKSDSEGTAAGIAAGAAAFYLFLFFTGQWLNIVQLEDCLFHTMCFSV
jgi:hypothetical protein